MASKDGSLCVPLILFSRRWRGNNSFNSRLKRRLEQSWKPWAQMTWRPFKPPTVTFQSKLTLHLSFYPFVCVSSYVSSTHLSYTIPPWAAVFCRHIWDIHVCIKCVLNVCLLSLLEKSLQPWDKMYHSPPQVQVCASLFWRLRLAVSAALRSHLASFFHSGVKRGVCSQINHFPEDADFDHDGAEYVLRKSTATLSKITS